MSKILIIVAVVIIIAGGVFFAVKSGFTLPFKKPVASPAANSIQSADNPENALILAGVKNALFSGEREIPENWDVSVSKVEGNYAKGMANSPGGGGIWFSAKVNGTWTVFWNGNGTIECKALGPYPDFPTDLVPQCLDASGNLVNR